MKKKVLMVMPVIKGGGAERVASLLLNKFYENGYDCRFLLTSSYKGDIVDGDLNKEIPVICIKELIKSEPTDLFYKLLQIISSVLCKPFELFNKCVPSFFAYLSFVSQYHSEINLLKNEISKDPDMTVITFLQPSIPITLLATKDLPNKVIISERGDPNRNLQKRYGLPFVKKYYNRADKAVFQTNDAKNAYPKEISDKGTVIFNPIKSDLPQAYHGDRNKTISTFCRISKQKNLPLLIKAFSEFKKDYSDYHLKIIGNTNNKDDEEALSEVKSLIEKFNLSDSVEFLPFSNNVHSLIIKDSMYVNSSDYEGMSNAMLEAMAIGMPCVCTDCTIGGASSVITDGENGLLVKVNDSVGLCEAMKKIAGSEELSLKLSKNAAKIADELSLENISQKWMELL